MFRFVQSLVILRKGINRKDIINSYNVVINEKNIYDQPTEPDIKRYEEIIKLIISQGEEYTAGCLLDYGYAKNH